MKRPSLTYCLLFLGLCYWFGIFWYLISAAVTAVGLSVAIKRLVYWKYLSPLNPPSNAAVLITGTSSGIGQAFALYLAQRGITVLATVRSQEDAEKWQKMQPELVPNLIKPVILDVTNEQSIAAAVPIVKEILRNERKQLHSVINNAGISEFYPIELLSKENFDRIMGINVWGPIAITKAFLPLLREYAPKGSAKIVFLSSGGVYMPLAFNGTYAASKLAVEGIADSLRVEVNPFGIDVIVIQPGAFKAPIFGKLSSAYKTFEANQANNPIYDSYKPRGDKIDRIVGLVEKRLNPPEILAEELYHALFDRLPVHTVASSHDSAFSAALYWLLPESLMTKFAVYIDKITFK